jgi:hypothetical protein
MRIVKGQTPHVSKGLLEDLAGVGAVVGADDRVECGLEELGAGFVSGAEAAIDVKDDGFDHIVR